MQYLGCGTISIQVLEDERVHIGSAAVAITATVRADERPVHLNYRIILSGIVRQAAVPLMRRKEGNLYEEAFIFASYVV